MRFIEERPVWQLALALAIVAMVPFLGALGAGFVYDDEPAILKNLLVTGDFSLRKMFMSGFWGGQAGDNIGSYRPLTVLTFAIDQRMGAGSPVAYHISNILFHGIAVATAFVVVVRRFQRRDIAVVATLIFGVHAVHVENVAGLVGRADVLATTFALLAWHASRQSSVGWRLASPLLLLAGLLSKEVAVAGLGLVAVELVLGTDDDAPATRRQRWWVVALLVVAVLAYLGLRVNALGSLSADVNVQSNPLAEADGSARVYTAFHVTAKAVSLQVLPVELSADYSFAEIMPQRSLWDVQTVGGVLVWLITPLLILYFRRRSPPAAIGLALALGAWAPVSNLFFLVPTIFGERLLYLSSLGLCLAVAPAVLLGLRGPRSRWIAAVLATVVVAHGVRAAVYTADWRDMDRLFATASRVSPRAARVWLNRGVAALDGERYQEAIGYFDKALAIAPRYGYAFTYSGIALDALARPSEAHIALRRGFEVYPAGKQGAFNLVKFYIKYGRWQQADVVVERYDRATSGGGSELRALLADARRQFSAPSK